MNKEEAYESLRMQIVTNAVAPGTILNEKNLMAQLGIGRSPLREVLFHLQEESLIKPLPRLGYMVTTLDIADVRELVELRRELEGFAGFLAAQRITAAQLEEMQAIIHEAETTASQKDNFDSIAEYFDTRFHQLLYQAAGNQKLIRMLEDLHIHMLRIWFHVGLGAIGFSPGAANFYKILDALKNRDPQTTRAAMESHVDLYAVQLKDKLI